MIRSSLIKRIQNCLAESKYLKIEIYDAEEIYFLIWENEAYIRVNLKTKEVYVDCENMNHRLNSEMLAELNVIVKILETSLDELQEWMEE